MLCIAVHNYRVICPINVKGLNSVSAVVTPEDFAGEVINGEGPPTP